MKKKRYLGVRCRCNGCPTVAKLLEMVEIEKIKNYSNPVDARDLGVRATLYPGGRGFCVVKITTPFFVKREGFKRFIRLIDAFVKECVAKGWDEGARKFLDP